MGYVVEPLPSGYSIWHYNPNLAGSIIFVILYIVITAALLWRMIATKTWFVTAMVVGGFFEIVGYGGRAGAHNNTGTLTPFIIQSTLLLVAPALFAATIYMTLGRIVRSVNGDHLSIIRPSWVTKIFVAGDVISFFVQAGGAGMLVKADSADGQKTGEGIIIGGLFLQIAIFGFFVVVAGIFQSRLQNSPTRAASDGSVPWREMLFMLYSVSALIMVRNIFRVIEYIMGNDGYLLQNEWPLYVFDGILMFGTMVIFFWRYPVHIRIKSNDIEQDVRMERHHFAKHHK